MIAFLKVRDVKSPERRDGDAGFDFFVPEFNDEFKNDCSQEALKNPKSGCYFKTDEEGKEYIDLPAGCRVNIPSGIKSRIELSGPLTTFKSLGLEMDLVAENKSGISTKYGLDVGACEVDPSYEGEIHISLTNSSKDDFKIYPGMKIVQFVPRIYIATNFRVSDVKNVSEEEFYYGHEYKLRKDGGFGSTNI